MPGSIRTGLIARDFKMAMRSISLALLLLLGSGIAAQWSTAEPGFWEPADSLNKVRLFSVVGGETVGMTGTYLALGTLWYAEEGLSGFHTFNDAGNWQGMDKIGHAMTAYFVGDIGMNLLLWSGVDHQTSVWAGGTLGLAFLTGVEILDGHSAGWGFSWSDMAANAAGTGLLIGQELLWQEQRITLKWSYHSTDFPAYNPDLLGENAYQSLLKDYNGHTYWLSFNVNRLSGWDQWPEWLNLSAGYGADGMVTAQYDPAVYNANGLTWQKQFYLAPDIDLRKIKVESAFLRTVLHALNYLKFPMPTLEINEKGQARFYPLYF